MRISLIVVSALVLTLSCSSTTEREQAAQDEWTITLKGKVRNPQQGEIVIQELQQEGTAPTETIKLNSDNTFQKKLTLDEPGYYRLNFYNKQIVTLILHKSDVEVNVDGSTQNGFVEVKGSPELDFLTQANTQLQSMQNSPEVEQLNQQYQVASQQRDQAKMVELQKTYQQLAGNVQDDIARMIRKQPLSLGVINFLQSNTLDKDRYFDLYVFVADTLREGWSEYKHAKDFIQMVDQMKATAIGQKAPEIALPNPEGDIVKLSSLRGKYVLVDFWAKWCGPCRQENPNVVRAYNKYKDEGFEVFGVSLDRNKEDWLKAIKEDNLTWTHVSDLKFWQSEAAKTYNISAIPFSLLLDPDGVIIAKNLRGPALDAKLAEIFNEK